MSHLSMLKFCGCRHYRVKANRSHRGPFRGLWPGRLRRGHSGAGSSSVSQRERERDLQGAIIQPLFSERGDSSREVSETGRVQPACFFPWIFWLVLYWVFQEHGYVHSSCSQKPHTLTRKRQTTTTAYNKTILNCVWPSIRQQTVIGLGVVGCACIPRIHEAETGGYF